MLEYAGQRDDPGHERRCTALLAALAWTHRQFSLTGAADMESVCRDLTQHLARSCREGVDANVLADALGSFCSENAPGGQSTDPSPAHVQLAHDVLATLDRGVDARQLLSELIGGMPERHEGRGNGVDELYRSALRAWVAVAPPRLGNGLVFHASIYTWLHVPSERGEREVRAIAADRMLRMGDGTLDLLGLRLSSLPELPDGLTTLDARHNGLTELPTLPAGLATLEATNNRLTELPTLPAGLATLEVAGNQLTQLPELPAGLRRLVAYENRLRWLPPLPAGLTHLDVHENRLRWLLPLPAGLTQLYANGNRLTELPPLPANLTKLDVRNNSLSDLPPSVFSMPHRGEVLVDGTLFSPAVLQRLREDTSARGYRGPQIHFFMASGETGSRVVRPLHEAVRDWLRKGEQAQVKQWQAYSEEANATEFSTFLDRLKASVNYRGDFKAGVAKWLTKLSQDEELRRLTFQTARGATETCEDRVALTYNDLTKLSIAHAISRGDYDDRLGEIIERGRGVFRLDALEKIAREKAQTLRFIDEIEIYLAYQVQLRNRLKLPTDIADMRYFKVSGISSQDLKHAEQQVLAQERVAFPHYFLVEWSPWQKVLERLDPEGTERALQQKYDMLPSYDEGVAAQLTSENRSTDAIASLAKAGVDNNERMKPRQLAIYKELTQALLRKRGEEALMAQIMDAAKPSDGGVRNSVLKTWWSKFTRTSE
ncbi:hypothetical protein RO07_20725 [Pandoraea pulmonicola]|uniref:NEL domain-containing protein n=1 Tax=Pandoraea pulmonicola TaxID=93221 RepID=A0ABN4UCN8_PANPU|nr:hypothetical protein RO07_20725 [Pandoraea pulmonicola]